MPHLIDEQISFANRTDIADSFIVQRNPTQEKRAFTFTINTGLDEWTVRFIEQFRIYNKLKVVEGGQ